MAGTWLAGEEYNADDERMKTAFFDHVVALNDG
jgi:hypothetical protein